MYLISLGNNPDMPTSVKQTDKLFKSSENISKQNEEKYQMNEACTYQVKHNSIEQKNHT